jgi:hypothetical protein
MSQTLESGMGQLHISQGQHKAVTPFVQTGCQMTVETMEIPPNVETIAQLKQYVYLRLLTCDQEQYKAEHIHLGLRTVPVEEVYDDDGTNLGHRVYMELDDAVQLQYINYSAHGFLYEINPNSTRIYL